MMASKDVPRDTIAEMRRRWNNGYPADEHVRPDGSMKGLDE